MTRLSRFVTWLCALGGAALFGGGLADMHGGGMSATNLQAIIPGLALVFLALNEFVAELV